MDVLSDLLKTIQFKSVVYFKHQFCSPWGMQIPKGDFAQFHLVVKGHCLLELESGETKILSGGDVLIFPNGLPHRILDKKEGTCISGREVVSTIMAGQPIFNRGAESATLICGHYELDKTIHHPISRNLPELIHINTFDEDNQGWLRFILDIIIRETNAKLPGGTTVARKLAEVLFIKVLRYYIDGIDKNTFLKAFSEPIVSQTLSLIHEKPEEDWSLKSLSLQVGASRTSLINKFKNTVGETPMKYLANWRMIKAKEILTKSDHSILAVSVAVGYHSEAAFIRAFKGYFNTTPANFRRARAQHT